MKNLQLPITPLIIQNKLYEFLVGRGFTGIFEIGRDKAFTNAAFQDMMKKVGWVSGQFWCMYYVKAVLYQLYSFDRTWINKNWTGSVLGNWNKTIELNKLGDKRYLAISENDPQIGDVVIWKSKSRGGGGHTAMVIEVIDKNNIRTIEGNTSEAGSRSGQGVFKLKRIVDVGKANGDFIFLGYIRRSFTEEEQKKLKWNEELKTFQF